MTLVIDQPYLVRNLQRRYKVDKVALTQFLQEIARAVGALDLQVTLALVGDARMRDLNKQFRGYDKSTDVLSFRSDISGDYLGDIVVSVQMAHCQAKKRGSNLNRELKVLTLHGFLHLLGYNHESDDGQMRRIEYRLRRRFCITTKRKSAK